jgi:tetratricopeptide (TPR) repeat protein
LTNNKYNHPPERPNPDLNHSQRPSIVYFLKGLHEEAVAKFLRAVSLDPKGLVAGSRPGSLWENLGATYMRLKQFPEAHQAYESAVKLEPENAKLVDGRNKAQASAEKQKKKQARSPKKKGRGQSSSSGGSGGVDGIGDGRVGSCSGSGGDRGSPVSAKKTKKGANAAAGEGGVTATAPSAIEPASAEADAAALALAFS